MPTVIKWFCLLYMTYALFVTVQERHRTYKITLSLCATSQEFQVQSYIHRYRISILNLPINDCSSWFNERMVIIQHGPTPGESFSADVKLNSYLVLIIYSNDLFGSGDGVAHTVRPIVCQPIVKSH